TSHPTTSAASLRFSGVDLRVLPAFPTRRSSDLPCTPTPRTSTGGAGRTSTTRTPRCSPPRRPLGWSPSRNSSATSSRRQVPVERSEEHTSELQSRENLVCRLLLEKKKDSNAFST